MNGAGRKVLWVTIGAVALYAAWVLFADVGKLRAALAVLEPWSVFAALGFAFANYLLRFGKWVFYLRRLDIGCHAPGHPYVPVPLLENLAIYLAGFAMSLTPGKIGEVFRSVLLSSARGVPVERSAPVMVADRLSDLLALVVLLGLGSTMFPHGARYTLAAVALVGAALVFVVFERLAHAMIDLVARVEAGRALAPRLRAAYAALRTVMSPVALLVATGVSVLAWSFECVSLYVLLVGLHAAVAPLLAVFAYSVATISGAVAIFVPGGLGATEMVMQETLVVQGHMATPVAVAATLLTRLATLWFAVALGFVALAVFRRRYDRAAVPS